MIEVTHRTDRHVSIDYTTVQNTVIITYRVGECVSVLYTNIEYHVHALTYTYTRTQTYNYFWKRRRMCEVGQIWKDKAETMSNFTGNNFMFFIKLKFAIGFVLPSFSLLS